MEPASVSIKMNKSGASSTHYLYGIDNDKGKTSKISYNFWKKIDMMDLVRRRIPIIQWLPRYKISYYMKDTLAGFTVALTEIPQGIAYAKVAGLDPVYGLYSGFMGCFMYFIFGSCKDLNIGPTSILSLMIQSHVSNLGVDIAVLCTFTTGCIIFLLGLFNLGFLVEFFSYPVIAGFTSAGALQIASSQLNSLFGIQKNASAFLDAWIIVTIDTTLGVISIIFLMILREFRKIGSLKYNNNLSRSKNILSILAFLLYSSRNALIVIIGTLLAYSLRGKDANHPFELTGTISSGIPHIDLPPFSPVINGTQYQFSEMIEQLGSTIIFTPLVAILETVAIAKAFSKGKILDSTQEMFAVGICNIMGSFVKSMPVTGSFTRTAVNNASGVVTTFGGVITGICVLLALTFLTSTFYYIPKSTLASVVISAMVYLFDYEAFVVLWRAQKADLIPLLVTFFTCLFSSLENGILIGTFCNLFFVLYNSARPKFHIKQEIHSGKYVSIISMKNSIQFPAAEYMRKIIEENCTIRGLVVVINGKNIGNMDATVARSFVCLRKELEANEKKLLFINFKPSVKDTLLRMDPDLQILFAEGSLEISIRSIDSVSDFTSISPIT